MTRSVEIPEAAVAAAAEGLRSHSAYEEPQVLARSALEAALPYLAPAGDGGLREALEALADEAIPLNGIEWVSARRLRELLAAHPAAHAVSVGTAESTASTSAVPQPAHCTCDPGPEGQHRYWCAIRRAELRELGVAPAALPQPVDREALTKVLDKHHRRVGPSITCSCGRWTERPVGSILWEPDEFAQHQADAVLAVLAGEQEQVEP